MKRIKLNKENLLTAYELACEAAETFETLGNLYTEFNEQTIVTTLLNFIHLHDIDEVSISNINYKCTDYEYLGYIKCNPEVNIYGRLFIIKPKGKPKHRPLSRVRTLVGDEYIEITYIETETKTI